MLDHKPTHEPTFTPWPITLGMMRAGSYIIAPKVMMRLTPSVTRNRLYESTVAGNKEGFLSHVVFVEGGQAPTAAECCSTGFSGAVGGDVAASHRMPQN